MINNSTPSPFYAITGASGRLGGLVLKYLLELVNAKRIIATTRNPGKLAEYTALGVSVRYADFDDPAGLPAAFSGTTRILIISTDAGNADKRFTQASAAINAAAIAGARHITIISAPNASEHALHPLLRAAWKTESMVAETGIDWTALRLNVWMEGLAYFLPTLRSGNQLLVPEGSCKPCWVMREDCARTAAYIIAGKISMKGAVELTGPDALGFKDLAKRWSAIQGRKLEALVLPDNMIMERLTASGLSQPEVQGIVGAAAWLSRTENVPVSDIVKRATGIPSTSVDGLLGNLNIS